MKAEISKLRTNMTEAGARFIMFHKIRFLFTGQCLFAMPGGKEED